MITRSLGFFDCIVYIFSPNIFFALVPLLPVRVKQEFRHSRLGFGLPSGGNRRLGGGIVQKSGKNWIIVGANLIQFGIYDELAYLQRTVTLAFWVSALSQGPPKTAGRECLVSTGLNRGRKVFASPNINHQAKWIGSAKALIPTWGGPVMQATRRPCTVTRSGVPSEPAGGVYCWPITTPFGNKCHYLSFGVEGGQIGGGFPRFCSAKVAGIVAPGTATLLLKVSTLAWICGFFFGQGKPLVVMKLVCSCEVKCFNWNVGRRTPNMFYWLI